ncbi:V-type proton ATPase 116 kDa subunit a 1-like [Leguminivora glycinivorella]|uniref:V-type proton ATPase 116 kDa subunit a 1-like n=1 Tax=Leguminivora glycinivorella TaxID=1035111 RepID=UPI00200BBF05|nr:V-type proton ATPase 116 kDa subunit a 1-like [Leguminivora glycinivorella]
MSCMLRSDPMTQCEMFLSPDAAFTVLAQLGEMECVQFTDLNEELNAFQRKYVLEICRIAEIERKLRYIHDKMIEDEIRIPKLQGNPPALELHETNTYETIIEKWERVVVDMTTSLTNMNKTYGEVAEMFYTLTSVSVMIGNADLHTANLGVIKHVATGGKLSTAHHHHAAEDSGARLTVITGLVQRKRSYCFQLMLWRLSHGCAFYKQADDDRIFKDPMNNSDVRKVAFLLVIQGEELAARMKKVCDGFRCDLYPLPPTASQRFETDLQLRAKIEDLSLVLEKTRFHRCMVMHTMARAHPTYLLRLRKAKAIYHTMNFFTVDITKNCMIGQCWIPTSDLGRVQEVLDTTSEQMATSVPCFMSKVSTHETPPTFHRTNKFTYGFQALISAYGDSTYRELNPGLYTIITFPFLFSLMFGDMGHGLIMFSAAVWMLVNEKKFMEERSDSEIWNIFFGGRYIMLLMSCFSMYSGFVYNDCFSKSLRLFTPGWRVPHTYAQLAEQESFLLEPGDHTHAYVFGQDPYWELASNKILFENSLKMKLSIIIGVTHMIFGITLSLFNFVFFKDHRYLIVLQFIPQILFLLCIFFWLVILIFFKWFKYGGASPPSVKEGQGCAPLVLILFIDMVLMSKSQPVAPECDAYMFGGQRTVQQSLLFVAVICVPIMLFGPPCFAAQVAKKKRKQLLKKIPDEEYEPEGYAAWKREMAHASESFSDLMIHQGVETIEFVLSTISHTASYLRLWALSLAHAQLSEMLWSMIFSKMALSDHTTFGAFKIVVVFIIWGVFTINILVLMEGLSAFLHTLRLHWVEFMSKFFMGTGIMFKPFSFEALFSESLKDKTEVCPTLRTFEY